MQNSLSVPPKDQGESHISSGAIQSGKGLQNKSQFRTIAPKIVPKVLTSRVLSCRSPSLSDQVNPGPSINAKPLGVPTQNYALMQVAGQEGTFSLVALPHVASAQPVQKPRLPLPENLKLPIPRYQPPRNNKGSRKKPVRSSSESGSGIPPAQTQTSPSPPDHPEPPRNAGPSEQAPSLVQAPAGVGKAAPTSQGGPGESPPPVTSDRGDPSPPAALTPSTPEEPSAKQDLAKTPGKANLASKKTCSKPSSVAGGKLKEQVDLAKAMTILSPALFGNTVQLISPVPRGKLPILPYARMKAAEVCRGPSDGNIADGSLPGLRAVCDQAASITEGCHAATKTVGKTPAPPSSKQGPCEGAFRPAARLDLSHKAKLSSGAAKRRVRKRKGPEDMLAFQGKRRKCIISKCKDSKERVKTEPQESREQNPGALKKYRSIMPKPVIVVPAAAPAGALPSPAPGGLAHDLLFGSSLPPKCAGWKQEGAASPRAGLRKPWYRCHVCNHHFQFKQHLRDHMNTHTDRRPYSCRICRKAYVRSGSLSAHMNLQHGESRPRKLVCCEFCAKVFGHVRVYVGHLKEVHRVVISTEPCPGDRQPGDAPKSRGLSGRRPDGSAERENKSSLEEDLLLTQADEVKLQIKCGRCQITAQSFAEIKFHLLYVHGEEIQGRLQEESLPASRGTQEDLVKHIAPFWKQHPERRKLLNKQGPPDEEVPKLKRQLCLPPQKDVEILRKAEGAQAGPSEAGAAPWGPAGPSPHAPLLGSHSGFNCVLCSQTLPRKEELLPHWEQQHNCEDPPRLWTIFNALSHQGVVGLAGKTEQ
ncbi:zinc finger protein 438 isoform X1 [Ursus maritimus]|uniref:Zinc finger protein 438 n=2 Tax=Ursus maritimus TaxID=29073 RepID=A0A8M1H239_URSMA|nr:zinc finger protein 438 isoform X1 [Ursus maritimus]XP_040501215.1 zinc finger protein 438 isoform X1 [Ursus maritimus]XP_040501216.1 zinc finger protein 438 isoform X1 [Ursus maritimus]XP_040501217.1 zinc finger protein 438 isoform X1 [Ursus maritimus]XP_040501218.1 zinc finger protein 438 isoform X1 [Ursus maritimus]XP_040501219.1 zinc finger protein 438 isoform X1 [Ursus maritimus]